MTNTRTNDQRTYGQWCPIAVGLDVIGDRWTLLICRELGLGDARFTDLRAALAGIAPNLLTERLRNLQAHGIVESVELPPPAARSVYRLTDEGRAAVIPVLRALARLGAPFLEGSPSRAFSARRAAQALLAPWYRSGDDQVRVRLILTDAAGAADAVDIVTSRDGLVLTDPEGKADVTIETTASALADARRTSEPLAATLTGPAAARSRVLRMFGLAPNLRAQLTAVADRRSRRARRRATAGRSMPS
ncbi:MAG: helix-turn-helix transcriptional regulator [Actinobacteria bacterium]|nr:helix-turn-helix transcriptional regulator [Actinomycetota bacterium]